MIFSCPGPVIAYGNSKNGITPLVSSIHDARIVAVRSTRAFTALTPIRTNDPLALAEVAAADSDYDAAAAAGLPQGDQPWSYYEKGYRSNAGLLDVALALGWSEAEIQASFDRVADDIYVSENWDQLAARGVDYFSLPGSPRLGGLRCARHRHHCPQSAHLYRAQRRPRPPRPSRGA